MSNELLELSICYFCDEDSKYTQPENQTGEIIDVCETHFSYRFIG